MHSSRSVPTLMNIEQMYSVTRGENGAWGIEGYEVPKKHVDARRQIEAREFLKQKKGEKSNKYITKRGHFLDDIAKPFRHYKGPVQYPIDYKWGSKEDGKGKAKSAPSKRMTFIDEIFLQNKKKDFPKPGPGAHNVTLTVEQSLAKVKKMQEKKIQPGERQDFLQDYEWLGDRNPGPGQFNPRPILPKLKMNTTKPDDWIKKAKEVDKFQLEKMKRYPMPDVGTYKHFPVDHATFGKSLQLVYDKVKIEGPKVKYWGNPPKPPKKLEKSKSSVAVSDSLIAQWPGKEDGKSKENKKFNWMNKVTKGIQKSIYY